ncbi:MAG TPA: PaaI family thioesterase [Kofleriaceae bacterium]|jgi:uncharacterized protein (TIGR00369 family)|nr:PaaI family thioesterase [Kofleriaceae bacterium]
MTTRTTEWQDVGLAVAGLAGKTGLEFLRAIIGGQLPHPPISATLDFHITAADEGYARFEGRAGEHQYNPMATVHGGVACTLLDSAMSCAVMSVLDAESAYTTAQLNVNLTRPITAATGALIAEGRILHRGRTLATAEGKLIDAKGTVLAHATTTCLIIPRR